MKKIIYSFCFAFLALGCASDDDSDAINPDDLDGDGVTNQREVIDGTDPENPCDYMLSSIFFPDSSNQWRNLDCDGDGVTNGNELDPDGNNAVDIGTTDPQVSCSLRVPKQTLTPSQQWQNGDCDDDSTSNAQEVSDDTDLNDPCSFILGNQDLTLTVTFKQGDCDQDGRTNIEEISEGTDLFDVNDPFEDGTVIREIILSYSYLDDIPFSSISFTDNGSKLDEFKIEGVIKTKFHYDGNDRLSLVEKFSSATLTVNYEFFYDGSGRIISITETTIDSGISSSEIFDYVYASNVINHIVSGNVKTEVILNSNNKVIDIHYYDPYKDPSINHSRLKNGFDYYDDTGNLRHISEFDQYWSVMYGFYDGNTSNYYDSYFSYDDSRPNYFLNAYENIYFNYILAPKIFEFHFYMEEIGAAGLFEDNFQTRFARAYADNISTNRFELSDHFFQENGFPFTAKGVPGNGSNLGGRKVYFFYE